MKRLDCLLIAAALAVSPIVSGCTQTTVPIAKAPPLYEQYKIQSADHWDTIADDVAKRVQKTLEDREDLIAKPLYVQPPNEGVFTRTFASLLRSRLVRKGMQVAEAYEPNCLVIHFDTQLVLHDSSRGDYGVSIAGLGISVGGSFVGGYTTISDHEVVITTHMVDRNRYVMSYSQVCYINDPDWSLYFDKGMLQAEGASADTIWKTYANRTPAFRSRPYAEVSPVGYQGEPTRQYTTGGYTSSNVTVTPIIEEYIMQPGGRQINPQSAPTPIGRKRR